MLLLFHLLQILFYKKKKTKKEQQQNIRKYIDTFELLIILINKQKAHIKLSVIF